ncbi:hypothetical protein A2U01_0015276 [Trifolium medium]|uniref:Uncharacterized protein n=1 Tax=Trifolium medium TaxID=97028 RepID=A0A392N5Q7_9FABA|nr:hypothetical protein [Trifolium medium]
MLFLASDHLLRWKNTIHGGLCENVIHDCVGLVAFEATTNPVQVVADTERDGWGSQVVEQCGAASGTSSPMGEVTR